MPLDPSIILGVQQPQFENPLDAMGKAMQFKALANQSQMQGMQMQQQQQAWNDQQAMRNAYANNTSADGSMNQAGMMKDLAQSSPSQIPTLQKNLMTMNADQLAAAHAKTAYGAQLLGGVSDQPSYDSVKQKAQAMGADTTQWPNQYDPNWVKSAQNQALTVNEQIANAATNRGLDIKAQQANIDQQKLGLELNKNNATQNQETLQAMQALRGNPALQRAETNVLSAKNINDLADQSIDPQTGQRNLNNLKPRQVNLIDHELVRMATGGTGNEQDMENLKPGTPQYNLALLHQKILGSQSPAQAGEFVQQAIDYANSLSKSSNQFLYQNAKGVVDAKRAYLTPQDAKQWDNKLNAMKNGTAFFGDVAPAPVTANSGTPQSGSPSAFTPDVVSYAQKHNITPAQAQSIKTQRQMGSR